MAGADLVKRRRMRGWRLGGRLLGLALVLALASCQTAPPPAPAADPEFDQAAELEALNLPIDEALRVRFLPRSPRRSLRATSLAASTSRSSSSTWTP